MADGIDIPAVGAAATAPPPAVTEAPAAAQLELATAPPAASAAPAVTEAPIVTEAPTTAAPAVTEAPTTAAPEASPAPTLTPEPTKSLLEAAGTAAPAASKAPDASPAPEAPTYELKLPEGVKIADAELAPYTALLAEHGVKPEAAQPLLDLYVAQMQKYADHLAQEQQRAFGETKRQWAEEVMADEQLGGSSHQTTMQAVARMRDLFVAPERREAFVRMLNDTGVGNHPEFIRLLHNAARWFDEPAVPAVQGSPLPSNGKAPGPKGLRAIYRETAAQRLAII